MPDTGTDVETLTPAQKRALLKRLAARDAARGGSDQPAQPLPGAGRVEGPLSFAQERLFLIEQLGDTRGVYNVPLVHRVRADLDLEALERALKHLLARHAALRTEFTLTADGPIQTVRTVVPFALRVVSRPPDATDKGIADLLAHETRQPFTLAEAPLLRALVVGMAPNDWILLIVMHHIVSDRRSMQILRQELLAAYVAELEGRAPGLPVLANQPADIAAWERGHLSGSRRDALRDYWVRELDHAPRLRWDADTSSSPDAGWDGHHSTLGLSAQALTRLKALAAEHTATPFMTLLAAVAVYLGGLTGQQDFVIGTPVSTRDPATANLIGLFVNILPLRMRVRTGEPFSASLQRVRECCLSAYEHRDLPFIEIVRALNLKREAIEAVLTPAVFQFDPLATRETGVDGVDATWLHWGTAKFPWDMCASESPDGQLRIDLECRADHFSADDTARHLAAFVAWLDTLTSTTVVSAPSGRDLQRRVLPDHAPELRSTLHDLFRARAARSPAAVALECGASSLTYGDLDARSSEVALGVRAMAARASRVGLIAAPGLDTVVGMLGILKAGCVYVPLDPGYPASRLRFMADDAMLTLAVGPEVGMPELGVPVMSIESLRVKGASAAPLGADTVEHDVSDAYVLYTSGSTGQPKGVPIGHAAVIRLFFGQSYAQFGPEETFLQMAPLSFDASTFELWGALLHGSRCVLETGRAPQASELGQILRTRGVTTAWLTAALFNVIVDEDPTVLRPLRQLLIGGEALSVPHVRKALAHLPDTQIVNGYGPTETAVFACAFRLPRSLPAAWTSIPIGTPIAHTTAHIVDPLGQDVPPGGTGELWVGGLAVPREYLNRAALSAEKIVTRGRGSHLRRFFRTGDRVRRRDDGELEFLGRLDHQVKIRGFRVEVEEVEAVLREHPEVSAACVGLRQTADAAQLVAFVSHTTATLPDLRPFLVDRLPDHMIPALFLSLGALPLTAHGKLDRQSLFGPAPVVGCATAGERASRPAPDDRRHFEMEGDPYQARLARIWCSLLHTEHVGFSDDFFTIGGDSLLSLRLLGRIRAEFGTTLELSAIYGAPTIQMQAALLRGDRDEKRAWLVRAGGDGPPLFCLGGDRLWLPLAARLPTRPVIGATVDFSSVADDQDPIKALARSCIELMRAYQPTGPYTVAGWCLWGLIAFETAQQLRSQGETVDIVVMVDTFPSFPSQGLTPWQRYAAWIAMELASAWFHLRHIRPFRRGSVEYVQDKVIGFLRRRRLASEAGTDASPHSSSPWDHVVAASYRYTAQPYDGRVLYCTPTDRPPGASWRFGPKWRRLVNGPFEDLCLPGNHRTMFDDPEIQKVADRLNRVP